MGYYTHYTVEVAPLTPEIDEEINDNDDYYAIQEYSDAAKWYDHDDDMKRLSIKHPESLFKLTGEGEESGDLWIKYYKNGKMPYCPAIVTYEEFDESKLL